MNWYIKRFNELTMEEMYDILEVRCKVFVVEQECVYQDCDGRDKNAYHLFAKENDKVVAYLRILDKGITFDELSIGRVLTVKEHRKTGLGRILMQKSLDFAFDELKEPTIRISAQEYLLKFYKSLGFEQISESYLEDDIPHIEMLCRGKK